jgi:hypothetical protein
METVNDRINELPLETQFSIHATLDFIERAKIEDLRNLAATLLYNYKFSEYHAKELLKEKLMGGADRFIIYG